MNGEINFDKYDTKGAGYHWTQVNGTIFQRNIYVIARYGLVVKQIGDLRGKRILDIGCGDGALTNLLAQNGGLVTGVDVSKKALKFAGEKTQDSGNIEFIRASGYNLPLRDGSFDHIISADTIEHLQEPEKMLVEIARLFNGKGKIIITTPLRVTKAPLDKMHVREFFEEDFQYVLSKHFSG